MNKWYDRSSDRGRHVRLDRLNLRSAAGDLVATYELENLDPTSDCNRPLHDYFALHCTGSVDAVIDAPASGNYTLEVVAIADLAGDELPRLDVAVLDGTHSGSGAAAIRDKLVELYDTLLGIGITPYSPEVNAAFKLFVDVVKRGASSGEGSFSPWDCRFHEDKHFFEGILDDVLQEHQREWGIYIGFDGDRVDAHINSINYSDVHYSARAWVVVLSYLLMDYRYLYL